MSEQEKTEQNSKKKKVIGGIIAAVLIVAAIIAYLLIKKYNQPIVEEAVQGQISVVLDGAQGNAVIKYSDGEESYTLAHTSDGKFILTQNEEEQEIDKSEDGSLLIVTGDTRSEASFTIQADNDAWIEKITIGEEEKEIEEGAKTYEFSVPFAEGQQMVEILFGTNPPEPEVIEVEPEIGEALIKIDGIGGEVSVQTKDEDDKKIIRMQEDGNYLYKDKDEEKEVGVFEDGAVVKISGDEEKTLVFTVITDEGYQIDKIACGGEKEITNPQEMTFEELIGNENKVFEIVFAAKPPEEEQEEQATE